MNPHVRIGSRTITLIRADITTLDVDVIVNAANASLAGGGGVDGAIHAAGGPNILMECRKIGSCPTGSAVATTAGKLHARYVFHAVGPIYRGSKEDERLLVSAYKSCLNLAEQNRIHSIAFPSLSTGVYGYPLELAAPVALGTIIEHLKKPTTLQHVTMVLYGNQAYQAYEKALKDLQ